MRLSKHLIIISLLFLSVFLEAVISKQKPSGKLTQKTSYREIISNNDYNKLIKHGSGLHVVKYYAEWCGACTQVKDSYKKLATKYKNQVNFSAIDIDKENIKPLLSEYKVASIPTIIFLKDGKEISRERGAMEESEFDNKIKNFIDQRTKI